MTERDRNKGGRPPVHEEPMLRSTIFLTSRQIEAALQVGNGTLSDGVRILIDTGLDVVIGQASPLVPPTSSRAVPRRRHQ